MLTFMEKKFYLVGITDFFIGVINKELVFSCKQNGKVFYAKIDSTVSISKENNFLISNLFECGLLQKSWFSTFGTEINVTL